MTGITYSRRRTNWENLKKMFLAREEHLAKQYSPTKTRSPYVAKKKNGELRDEFELVRQASGPKGGSVRRDLVRIRTCWERA